MKVALSLLFHSDEDSQKLRGKSSLVSPVIFVASLSYPTAQGWAFGFLLAAPTKGIDCEISPALVANVREMYGVRWLESFAGNISLSFLESCIFLPTLLVTQPDLQRKSRAA